MSSHYGAKTLSLMLLFFPQTCVQFFTDGYESVAMVMSVVFYYLTVYPDIQTKLQEELDEVMERKEDHTAVEQTDLNDMVYLDQVKYLC